MVEGAHSNDVKVGRLEPHDIETTVESPAATFVMTMRLAVLRPVPDGVHATWKVQLAPPGMPVEDVEQLSDTTLKSAALGPVMLGSCTTSGPVPVFDTVKFLDGVVTPMPRLGKKMDVGVTVLPYVSGVQLGYRVAPIRVSHCHGSETL